MHALSRLDWRFAAFAGGCAFVIASLLILEARDGYEAGLSFVGFSVLAAAVAARAGCWLSRGVHGHRHFHLAALYCSMIFSVALGIFYTHGYFQTHAAPDLAWLADNLPLTIAQTSAVVFVFAFCVSLPTSAVGAVIFTRLYRT